MFESHSACHIFDMKYLVEIIEPKIVEVEAPDEESAIKVVKGMLAPQLKLRDNIDFKIVKEVILNS